MNGRNKRQAERRTPRVKALGLSLLLAVTTASYGQGGSPGPLEIRFKKLREDIYLAYRPETLRYWVEGNVVIIVNDSDVVVVDASGTPRSAQTVIAEIRRLTNKPVRYLINTHGHGDHTVGNQEYVKAFPGVEIVAHEKTAEYVSGPGYQYVDDIARSTESRKKEGEAEIARLQALGRPADRPVIENLAQYYRRDINVRQAEYRKVKRTPPTVTVAGVMRLHRGNRIIEVLHLGAGDTPGDLIVYLPRERLVCTGDMVTEPVPFGFSRFPLEWKETLGRLAQLDFDTLVPGHGEVQQGKDYVRSLMALLQSVQEQVRAGAAAGLGLEAVRGKVDLSEFVRRFAGDDAVNRYYFHEYFTVPNVERTFNALKAQAGQK
jgi:cyclase